MPFRARVAPQFTDAVCRLMSPLIVPSANSATAGCPDAPAPESLVSCNAEQQPAPESVSPPRRNYSWAQLMKRVFAIDVLQCERCGGRMRIVSAIHPPETTRKILDCLGLPNRAPPLAPAVPEPTLHLD